VCAATKEIREVYLDTTLVLSTVIKCFAKFRSEDFNIKDQTLFSRKINCRSRHLKKFASKIGHVLMHLLLLLITRTAQNILTA